MIACIPRILRKRTSGYPSDGYTLIEIIVVVTIIGILAMLGIGVRMNLPERFRAQEGVQILTVLLHGQKDYQLESGDYATDINDLAVSIDGLTYFASPDVDDPGNPVTNPVATVDRINGYILGINENGEILCYDDLPGFICEEAGFEPE